MRKKIQDYLEAQVGRPIDPSERLISTALIDSLATVRLMGFLQKECGVDISDPDFDVEMLDTLDDLMLMIEEK